MSDIEWKRFLPRGYVDRERWLWINDRCDPGDAARDCPVHFIPHKVHQLPSMIEMMSVEEHNYLLSQLEERLRVAKKYLSDTFPGMHPEIRAHHDEALAELEKYLGGV